MNTSTSTTPRSVSQREAGCLCPPAPGSGLTPTSTHTGQWDKVKSPFEWDIVTRGLVAMTAEGFVGFLLTLMCQYNFLRQPQ